MERPKDLDDWAQIDPAGFGYVMRERGEAARYAKELEARIAELERRRDELLVNLSATSYTAEKLAELEARIQRLQSGAKDAMDLYPEVHVCFCPDDLGGEDGSAFCQREDDLGPVGEVFGGPSGEE